MKKNLVDILVIFQIVSMRNLKLLLADTTKHKARVNQLYFVRSFLQGEIKNGVFVKLDNRYVDCFPEYLSYFGRALILLKSMDVMINSGKLFAD